MLNKMCTYNCAKLYRKGECEFDPSPYQVDELDLNCIREEHNTHKSLGCFGYQEGSIAISNAINELKNDNDISCLIIKKTCLTRNALSSLTEKQLRDAINAIIEMPELYKLVDLDKLQLEPKLGVLLDEIKNASNPDFIIFRQNKIRIVNNGILRKIYPRTLDKNKFMNDIFEKKGISVDDDNLPIPDQLTAAFNELICIPNLVQLINGNMGLSDVQTGEADIETRLKNKEKMVSIYPDTLRMSRKCICEGKVLPLKLQAKTFETFQLLDGLGEIFNKSKEFINSSKSLYLYGGPGNGKTHLLAASYNQAVKECPKCCCYYNVEDLVCFKRCEYQTKEDVESEAINKIMKYQLVYLDDFVIKSDSYKYSSFFYRLFNKALENGKPRFFITANQSIKSIAVKMEDRIASRIAELCGKENIIINLGEDQRVK